MPHRYLTVAELLAFRGEAELLRLAPVGGPATPSLDSAIEQAEAEATSYLLGRYRSALPSAPGGSPPILKAKVAAIAHRKLVAGGQPSPSLETEYQQALTWLRDVARGAASLDLPTAPPADDTSPAVAAIGPTGPGLRLEDLESW
ncbi:MAG TPA: phage protein Gp36 family protein [Thermoanaerobaculia bacterium]|nr:phage protein Gp36 family protein [Thermoanaerobaculia bacterium]